MSNNAYVSGNGDASNLGRSEGTFLFYGFHAPVVLWS